MPMLSDFQELARVMKTGGQLVIADPTPNLDDTNRFVDAYMRIKPDGHIKYYTKDEFERLGTNAGFSLSDAFQTEITFPRLIDTDMYRTIMDEYDKDIISGYQVHGTQDRKYIYITQKVWNLVFKKIQQKLCVNTNDGSEHPFLVCVPDMEIFTEGVTLADAVEMARDAIGAAVISMEDSKRELPSCLNYVPANESEDTKQKY